MILEEATSERHLVRCLNYCRAVVSQALVFIQVSHVELGREELLAQSLQRRVVHLGRVGSAIHLVLHVAVHRLIARLTLISLSCLLDKKLLLHVQLLLHFV